MYAGSLRFDHKQTKPRTGQTLAWTEQVKPQGRAGRAGQGRAGQGRAGQGRAGRGRARQGQGTPCVADLAGAADLLPGCSSPAGWHCQLAQWPAEAPTEKAARMHAHMPVHMLPGALCSQTPAAGTPISSAA